MTSKSSKNMDYVPEDIYSNYNKEQKNILRNSREDRIKLQNLNQRNEDTLQSEKVIQIQNNENPTNRYYNDMQYSEANSQNITFSRSPRDQSKITAINIQQSDYQIVLGQSQDQKEADLKAEVPLLADQQSSSTQQSQFLKIDLPVRRQGKRLSYVHGIVPRKESRMRSIIAVIQKHKKENKVDEIKLISKIKLRINQFFKKYTLTGRRDNLNLISKREQIIKLYLKNNVLYDFIPLLSIQLIYVNKVSSLIFKIITYVKLKNVLEEISDLQKQICMAIKKYYYVQLFNLISQVFIIGHSIACAWYLLAYYELEYIESENWLSEKEQIWWKLYIESLFWALTLMTTGSNESKTVFEALFTSIIMLFICIIFCYLLDSIGNILADINEKERMMKKDINIINEFMRTHHISRNLQRSVNKDLENFYEKNYKKLKEENESVLQKISPHLKIQINKESYKKYVDKIAFIIKNFSKETIEKLCQSVEELYFTPNQILFNQNDNDSFCLMYIVEGQVELFRKCEQDQSIHQKIGILDKDSIIGQHSFLTGQQRMAGAKSKTFSTIIQISRDNFLKIIKQNEEDYQKFCLIKDNIMIYKNFYNIGVCCSICKNYLHYSQDCPLAHLDREQAYGKAKFLEKMKQSRSKYERKLVKFENSLAVQQKLYEIALFFQDIITVSQDKLNEQKSCVYSDQESQNSEEEKKTQSLTEEYFNSKKGSQLSNTMVDYDDDKKKQNHSQIENYSEQIKQKRLSIDYKNRAININVNEFHESKNKYSSKEDFEIKNTKNYLSPQSQEQDQNYEPKRSALRDDHHKNIHFRDEQENYNKFKSFDKQPSELSTLKHIGTKQIQYQIEQSMHFTDMRQNKQKKLTAKSIIDQRKVFNSYLSHDNEEANSKEYYQSPWVFDKQKDYTIYFPDGNLSVVLFKYSKFQKKIQTNKKINRKSQRR
ncbi:cation channel family protein (macronuclear) [Tetrahymena thermophila SB210]|uniref:Cation channel family protein n=1 Tax=Tetrahymena thermophila (strain SB210) TaxID=312017 RepID=I7LWE0_TETTS|nr:cation channel family protein [Tetrahymena thermophila SB210]EAS01453.2 cation channel family protein [Tetrahymena thermophila SB210]|eukprot:XP_001021699.2 cation channel family protein [Tetrahymena thermophila SB210]